METAQPATVPRWQPDEEAAECFLCHHAFTFFYRRHHCRKCGRVVCGSCSKAKTTYVGVGTPVVRLPGSIFDEPLYAPHRTCDSCIEEFTTESVIRNNRGTLANVEGSMPVLVPANGGRNIKIATSNQRTSFIIETDDDSERDHCPICSINLSNLSEEQKEDHINSCLVHAEFSGSPDQEQVRGNNRMLVYNIPDFPKKQIVASCSTSTSSPYVKEKESSDYSDECVICLEELLPGEKVGRLECLCVFHYKCITGWFKQKGSGKCPVHAAYQL